LTDEDRIRLSTKQREFVESPIEEVLLIAPAGCGKTEALAARVAHLVDTGEIKVPRKALALSFSNKAKANIATRLSATMGNRWNRNADVMNLHGFSARVIQAHGKAIGLDPALVLPDKVWYQRACKSVGVNYNNSAEFERVLRNAKSGPVDDQLVMDRLTDAGNSLALKFERQLRDESRLDFNDLLRLGQRVLQVDAVREIYRLHFSVVLVDEVQDLSWDQFELVKTISSGCASYAGDPAQGIYAFAGAEPDRIFTEIESTAGQVITLNECHRSSPAVIRAINVIARRMGSTELECASPEKFPGGGVVATVRCNDPDDESVVVVQNARRILDKDASVSIGIIVRRGTRLGSVRSRLDDVGLNYEDWTAPTHVAPIVELMVSNVVDAETFSREITEQIAELKVLCLHSVDEWDIDVIGEVIAACDEMTERVRHGLTLRQAVQACKRAGDIDSPVCPGVHLLNAHIGKGQEFDWVMVMGMEDGVVPDFRATDERAQEEELRTLHVMLSRAKFGLAITAANMQFTQYGSRTAELSPWWNEISATATESWN
jgi:DNA helicase-2/ATP-dependent DNA helicase PcrA